MKKLEIEKTKPTFIISVLKVDIIKVGLIFSISNFFITKMPLVNNWRRKKIPSCSYLALETRRVHHFVTNNVPNIFFTSIRLRDQSAMMIPGRNTVMPGTAGICTRLANIAG